MYERACTYVRYVIEVQCIESLLYSIEMLYEILIEDIWRIKMQNAFTE